MSSLADGTNVAMVDSSDAAPRASGDGPTGPTADALAAFLAGLNGFGGDAGTGGPAGWTAPIAALLSNGLNADAGVAQLVSALASVRDSSSAFGASPFAAPGEPGTQGVIATESG